MHLTACLRRRGPRPCLPPGGLEPPAVGHHSPEGMDDGNGPGECGGEGQHPASRARAKPGTVRDSPEPGGRTGSTGLSASLVGRPGPRMGIMPTRSTARQGPVDARGQGRARNARHRGRQPADSPPPVISPPHTHPLGIWPGKRLGRAAGQLRPPGTLPVTPSQAERRLQGVSPPLARAPRSPPSSPFSRLS